MAGFSSTAEEDSTCMSDGCWSAGFDMTVAAEADLRRRAQMRSRRRGAEAECVRPSSRKGLNPDGCSSTASGEGPGEALSAPGVGWGRRAA